MHRQGDSEHPARRSLGGGILGGICAIAVTVMACGAESHANDAIAIASIGWPFDASLPEALEPQELLLHARNRCTREIAGYQCTFTKWERRDGKLGKRQKIDVDYRQTPRRVSMTWLTNIDRVKRAVYEEGCNLGSRGEERVRVEPSGMLARIFAKVVDIPISDERIRDASRYPIDQFGCHAVLQRIVAENAMLEQKGMLDWRYEGDGSIDGRPTIVVARHLPVGALNGTLPPRLVVHLDEAWLMPVAVYSYADHAERVLLGSYVTTQVEFEK